MKKFKSALQRIITGVLALVFTVTLTVPKAKAVTGVDDVSVGIMAVLVHLDSIGGSLAVQQGTALATQNAVTALATQAGAAGALGTGVTGTAALATIGGSVVAAAVGGFTIGYVGYETLSKLAEWIRQASLTGTAVNKIYQTGGPYRTFLDGTNISWSQLSFGTTYQTQAGSSICFSKRIYTDEAGKMDKAAIYVTTVTSDGVVQQVNGEPLSKSYWRRSAFDGFEQDTLFFDATYLEWGRPDWLKCRGAPLTTGVNDSIYIPQYPPNAASVNLDKVFNAPPNETQEKQEVTYVPPVTWSPPAPVPGQDVYYNPYPNAPQKPIKEIVEDVPKDIYDKKFDPAPPQVVDPTVPPVNPDLPPDVNPNPPVEPPAEVQPYTVQLGDVFPFCIPFDLYHMVTLFVAEPEAPHAKWEFNLPFTGGTYEIEWDLQEWDEVAALCRKMELVLFCVGLAVVTYKLIKW